jgi:hypothetical protein
LEQLDLAIPAAQNLAKAFPSNSDYQTRLAYVFVQAAKTHEEAAKHLPAQAENQNRLAKEAWRQSLELCTALNAKGLLSAKEQPMLVEAKLKAH